MIGSQSANPTPTSRVEQMIIPRYLASFDPKQLPHFFTDLLIVGGGLAGLRAANEAHPDVRVLVVTKDEIDQSNSTYAQGGIAGVLSPDDDFESHVRDTLEAGGELCDPVIVARVVREAPERIQELMTWGTNFDRDDRASLMLGREGGHSHHRIVHALGDATGKEVMRAVIQRTTELPNVTVWRNTFTIDLLTDDGVCCGGLVQHETRGRMLVWAKQVIICTGGAGQIYRESTNPDVATGDGHALAFRAGAELRDMEFMQFHPTVLYIAGSSRSLITEALRGEGAYLVDRNGQRFMLDYDERAELAPRDVVSQAIVTQMEKTQHPNVYLTLSHLDADEVRNRFPSIASACAKFGIDITTDPVPVRPGAHYMIGGVTVDDQGRTTAPGLWAAGEVTSSGLHGANRLASNSLLEGLVYGAYAGRGASREALETPEDFRARPLSQQAVVAATDESELNLSDIRNSLKSQMWRAAGVRRERDRLLEAAAAIDHWGQYVLARQFEEPNGWELQNMLIVSRIVAESALWREESRGVHFRTDFPDPKPDWCRRLSFSRADDGRQEMSES
jgi:L-aspartate oxidase